MKKNPIYESLIDKSIGSMLSAIEIYNKPDFKYREETFAKNNTANKKTAQK